MLRWVRSLTLFGSLVALPATVTAAPTLEEEHALEGVPYTTRILANLDPDGHIKPIPWNREPEIDAHVDSIVARQQRAREHGVFVYSLGDETVTRGYDTSPSDLAAYRAWLAAGYGTIAALNRSWGTDFSGFDDIHLLDPQDPTEAGARQAGNYARWYDRQAWASASFVRLCRRFGEAFARLDPQARTGFEGAGRFDRGDDFDGIVNTNGFWSPYPGPGDHIIRSIAPRDFPRANWMGYVKDADPLLWKYWRMVLNGTDAVWWWRWDGIGRFNGLLTPVLNPFPQVAEMVEDTRLVRQGLGDLLLHYEMQDDGIAMLYSTPSAYATQLEGGPSYGAYSAAHEAWHRLLFDNGLNFRYVADLRPGLFDGHCKPRGSGVLDEVFGIVSGGLGPAHTADALLRLGPDRGLGAGRVALEQVAMSPDVRAAGAETRSRFDATPLVLVRQAGRGRAILLNCAVDALPAQMAAPEARAFVTELLHAGGVSLEPSGPFRMTRWRRGQIEILGIQTEGARSQFVSPDRGEAEARCRLALPAKVHAYDVCSGADLGSTDVIELSLPRGRAQFLALLPTAAPAIQPTLAGAARRGEVPALRLALPKAPGPTAAFVTLEQPDGTPADWIDPVVTIAPGSHADVALPLALDDPLGTWTVRARELFTGRVAQLTLTVTE